MEEISVEKIENAVKELASDAIVKEEAIQNSAFTPHTKEEYEKIEDSFLRYRVMVNDALALYEQAREMASISETGLSESIFRMAQPFRKGFFTLAVVGKMSAGKSTFINALLGDNGLLPTGHFQTTCTLTTIQHSDEKRLHVVYGDKREEEYEKDISEKLRELVAIPPKYKDLPINNVNRFILYDVPTDEICGERLVGEMENLSKKKIDIELLKEYFEGHSKDKIPMAVAIECPLSENYRGWRIVDTPGVDAIGGIEDDTKQFLCGSDEDGNRNVDAIIFVQAAQANIEDLHLNEFVSETINSLTEEARKRTFFVLTHGAEETFLDNKEGIMASAKSLFVDYAKIGIDCERLIAVDSIASLLEEDAQLDLESLIKSGLPKHWNAKEWNICKDILRRVYWMLQDGKVEVNNENLRRKLRELANFSNLRSLLNVFVQDEKKSAFNSIIDLIEKDIDHCINTREKDIQILQNNLGRDPEDFQKDLEKEKAKLDDFQQSANDKIREVRGNYSKTKVDEKFQNDVFKGVSLDSFKSLSSLNQMRRKAEQLGDQAKAVEKSIVTSIKEEVKEFVNTSQISLNIAIPAIDIDQIEHDAKVESTTYTTETYRVRKKTDMLGGNIRRFFGGLFGTDWGYETSTRKIAHTDVEKEHDLVATAMYANLRRNLDSYQSNVQKELKIIEDNIDKQIKEAIKSRKANYDDLAKGAAIIDKIKEKEGELTTLQVALNYLEIYK